LSIGKDVEFHIFAKKEFSTAKMWKMWKTTAPKGAQSPESREKAKSCPHPFPHIPPFFVENSEKLKIVPFAQIFLFMVEKRQKVAGKKWDKHPCY
jgi:hypothetical protein